MYIYVPIKYSHLSTSTFSNRQDFWRVRSMGAHRFAEMRALFGSQARMPPAFGDKNSYSPIQLGVYTHNYRVIYI